MFAWKPVRVQNNFNGFSLVDVHENLTLLKAVGRVLLVTTVMSFSNIRWNSILIQNEERVFTAVKLCYITYLKFKVI